MINVINVNTNEVIKVDLICNYNGVLAARKFNPEPGTKFYASYPFIVKTDETIEVEGASKPCRVVTLSEGYELKIGRSPREKKSEDVTIKMTDEPKTAVVVSEPAKVATPTADEYEAELLAKYGRLGQDVFHAAVKYVEENYRPTGATVDEEIIVRIAAKVVEDQIAKMCADDPKKKSAIKKAAKKDTKKVHCAKYDRILAKMSRGRRVYLYGPAGSGKSHTAEQIADDLGLPFYGQTTIQFAHDVRGYGDAGGNFQDTPFYKAFAFGGVYFQDEYDRSNAEAAIVLNSALANGWYDFPIVGRVEAHPDFRFMAAGNTLMKGADDGYITGQEIDPSSRDRFDFYFQVGYLREVELHIAHGNEEIVNFVEDVRQAIKSCGIEHVVSYRATAAMTDEIENENDLVACCEEGVFKGLDVDARREIYQSLQNKDNRWAKALKKTL